MVLSTYIQALLHNYTRLLTPDYCLRTQKPTMNLHRYVLFFVLSIALLSTSEAVAQQIDSTLVTRYQLADSYLRAGQYDRAITLLQDLYEESPATYAFFEKLKEAYENVKRYDEAIALVEDRIPRDANLVGLLSEKARLQFLRGDETIAYESWQKAIDVAPSQVNTYRIVYQSLSNVRLFEKSVEVLEGARVTLNDQEQFQVDLAWLYSLVGEYAKSMQEYVGILAKNDRQLSYVRSRLGRFVEQENVLDEGIPVVEEAVRVDPLNRSFRELLGWLYLENRQFSEAFDVYRAIDRLEQEEGNVLFTFAQQAADAGAYEVSAKAFDEVLDRYPNSPAAPEAQLGLARMHEKHAEDMAERAFDDSGNRISAPNYEAALDNYRIFLQEYPSHAAYPEVLQHIGRLQQEIFYALGDAESTLKEVIEKFPASMAFQEANFDMGRIAVLRDELPKARLIFSRVEEELRIGELAERARFELALIHFYQGEFDAALTLTQVMNENTSTDIANDAIELKVLLFENKGPDSLNAPLNLYADASLAARQRLHNKALSTLDSLMLQYGNHPLMDDARFLKATTLREIGRTEEALAAFLEFPLIHPESFFVDRSLFTAAQIYDYELGKEELAIETYSRLLNEYSGSLLASQARERIRILRGDGI